MKVPDQIQIERTLNNEATPEEAREVVCWFSTSEGQSWLSARMDADEKAITTGDKEALMDHVIPSVVMYERIMRQIHRRQIRLWMFRAAAILLPIVLFVGLFMDLNSRIDLLSSDGYDEIYVPKGERMQVAFQDGSKVYLNSESRIRYPHKFGLFERKVQLEGEAWFEVSKNKNRPFIVDLKCVDVRVLGTTFDIKAYPKEDISITLETGSVELNSKTFYSFKLKPGEKAVYNRSSGRCAISGLSNVALSSAWKRNKLVFHNASLSEVMTTLTRAYNVTFAIEDSLALNYNYTLVTDNVSLVLILKELEKITPVRFDENNGGIKVHMSK